VAANRAGRADTGRVIVDTGQSTGQDVGQGGDRAPSRRTPSAGSTDLDSPLWTWVSLATLFVVLARVTVRMAMPLDNTDTWFHLRIGRELLGPWSLRHPGQLSSFGDAAWLPTQWSTEMVMAQFERWFGLPGVAWLFGALCLALLVGLYVVCRGQAEAPPAVVATALATIATTAQLSARPQVVTLILLVVVVAAWLRAERTEKTPWLLVPLTWLWATAHGMWTIGVVVGVVWCVGLLLDRTFDRRAVLRMLAVPTLSVVAACLTPLGPALLGTQLAVGARAPLITEWAATDFRQVPALVAALMIGLVVLRWAVAGRKVPWTHVLLLLLAAGWAMLVGRMVSCSAVLVAPLLAQALQGWLRREPVSRRLPRVERLVLAGGTLALLVGLAVAVPATADHPAGVPTAFGARLAALPAGTPIAVEDGTGAWIEWRYPGLNPVIDGMLDAYPVDYIKRYADYVDVKPGWREFLADSSAKVAVVHRDSALSDAMRSQLHWRQVDRDGRWVYLEAPDG
jgi:hypothetical protein